MSVASTSSVPAMSQIASSSTSLVQSHVIKIIHINSHVSCHVATIYDVFHKSWAWAVLLLYDGFSTIGDEFLPSQNKLFLVVFFHMVNPCIAIGMQIK